MAETKPDCLNSDLALPGILLNARNQRTKGMPEGSRDKRVDNDDKQKRYKERQAKLGNIVLKILPKVMQTILKECISPRALHVKYL